ncbi:MAG TPA: Ig-like domain-containing protein [Chthoniobacterales bacterium]|jgi:RNA polymerase sigma-70 factor (ECF subfamily)|nr:Ig-like domain-containing protein [Chthoniobacterales bacterium]
MKMKLILSLLLTSAISIAFAEEITLDSARPVVIKSVPEAGSAAVDPSMTEIRVTFSKDMQPGVWSWGMMNKESYPGTTESPKYMDDKRTCVLPVKLQPGKTYAVWINTEKLQNFKDTKGMVAVPYLLVFKTRD